MYERDTVPFFSLKTIFAEFQCIALGSFGVATPASPIAPALAFGVINRKGTAEVMVFCRPSNSPVVSLVCCALKFVTVNPANIAAMPLKYLFIYTLI